MKIFYTLKNKPENKDDWVIIEDVKRVEVCENISERSRLIGFDIKEDKWDYLQIKIMNVLKK